MSAPVIAAVAGASGQADAALSALAWDLAARGIACAGIVRAPGDVSHAANGCEMVVRVLPDGPDITITQALGPGSDACRLDPSAIAEAVARVEGAGVAGADLFILNKFGPEEAAGRGFRPVIAAALECGVPVLVGVGAGNRTAFDSFAAGLAQDLPAEAGALRDWCAGQLSGRFETSG